MQEQNQKIQEIVSSDQDEAVQIDQVAKIRGWFGPADHSPYYPVIQEHLSEQLTLKEVSNKLFPPIDKKISEEKLDDVNFMDLWYSIIHSARRINYRGPHAHEYLVTLVSTFKEHSIPDNEKYNYLFNSMTDFNMASREVYNDQPTPGQSFGIEITAWTNMNFFLAALTGKEIADNSIFAIWAMRQALETPHEDDEESTAVEKYNTYVPTAAAWVFGGFRVLFHKEEDLTPKDKKSGNPGRGGPLWKGKGEFSKERWYFWRERFAEIGKMDDVSEDTRTVAKDAVQAMERAATFEKI
jgi:hypothetical protein